MRLIITIVVVSAVLVGGGAFLNQRVSDVRTDIAQLSERFESHARQWLSLKGEVDRLRQASRPVEQQQPQEDSAAAKTIPPSGQQEGALAKGDNQVNQALQKRVDGSKIVADLGTEASRIAKQARNWTREEILAFLHDKTGIELDPDNRFLQQRLGLLKARYDAQMQVVACDQEMRMCKIRQEMDESGRFEEVPAGTEVPGIKRDPMDRVATISFVDGDTNTVRRYIVRDEEFPEAFQQVGKDIEHAFVKMLDQIGEIAAEFEKPK